MRSARPRRVRPAGGARTPGPNGCTMDCVELEFAAPARTETEVTTRDDRSWSRASITYPGTTGQTIPRPVTRENARRVAVRTRRGGAQRSSAEGTCARRLASHTRPPRGGDLPGAAAELSAAAGDQVARGPSRQFPASGTNKLQFGANGPLDEGSLNTGSAAGAGTSPAYLDGRGAPCAGLTQRAMRFSERGRPGSQTWGSGMSSAP